MSLKEGIVFFYNKSLKVLGMKEKIIDIVLNFIMMNESRKEID